MQMAGLPINRHCYQFLWTPILKLLSLCSIYMLYRVLLLHSLYCSSITFFIHLSLPLVIELQSHKFSFPAFLHPYTSPAFRVLLNTERPNTLYELQNQMMTMMVAWGNRQWSYLCMCSVLYYVHIALQDVHIAIKETGERAH